MVLQALGSIYSALGNALLNGGKNTCAGGGCHNHSKSDAVSRSELTQALESFKYGLSQPSNNVVVNNSVANSNTQWSHGRH